MRADRPAPREPVAGQGADDPYAHLGAVVFATDVIDSAYDRRRTRTIILRLAFSVGLMMTGFGIIMPVFARRRGELGSGVEGLGLMTMSFALAQFLSAPVMGSLADRYGRRPLIRKINRWLDLPNRTYLPEHPVL